jgi:hypothetical protein
MMIYGAVGVDKQALEWWYTAHQQWHWKTTMAEGDLKWMRLTGQATTALGNFLVNLMTHREFLELNDDKLTFVMMLGDDFACGFT